LSDLKHYRSNIHPMARIHSILSTSTSRRPSILLTKKGMSPTVTRNLKMRTRINKNLLQLKTHTDHPFFVVVPGRCRNGSAGRATHSPLLPSPLRPPPSPKNADAIGMTRSSGTASSSPPPPVPTGCGPFLLSGEAARPPLHVRRGRSSAA
jgi:hypothetical protein